MNPIRPLAICCVLALSLPGPVLAEAGGLRVSPQSWSLLDPASGGPGLRVSVSDLDNGVGPLSLLPNSPQLNSTSGYGSSQSTSTWADWQPFGGGWRTSAGLVWRQNQGADSASSNKTEASAVPFLGFGWSGQATARSNWRLSAEMGAYLSNARDCTASGSICLNSAGTGLNIGGGNGGIRSTPYLSIGASYLY